MLGNKGSRKFYRSGGTRGGQDQFKWEDVKTDKYRENYLGHSVLAPVGRWQKGKDLNWYAKSKSEQDVALDAEKEMMRQQDEDLINETLGLKKKRRIEVSNDLDAIDLKQLLSRGGTERAPEDVQRIQGLGAAPAKVHDHIERESFYTKEISRLQTDVPTHALPTSSSSSSSNSSSSAQYQDGKDRGDGDEDGDRDRHERKSQKHEHKEHREPKKEKSKKHSHDKDHDRERHGDRDRDKHEHKEKKHKKEKNRKRDRSRSRSRS